MSIFFTGTEPVSISKNWITENFAHPYPFQCLLVGVELHLISKLTRNVVLGPVQFARYKERRRQEHNGSGIYRHPFYVERRIMKMTNEERE